MRVAAAIGIAVLLLTLPTSRVLGQTPTHGPTSDEIAPIPQPAAHRALRVPTLTHQAALLWQPTVENRANILEAPSPAERAPVPAWSDYSDEMKILIVVGALVVLAIVL